MKTDKEEAALPQAENKERGGFSRDEWKALLLGLGLAVLWFQVFDFWSLMNVPGLGTTAFVLAALGGACVYLGRGRISPSRGGTFLVLCTALLAVACGLFEDRAVRLLDLAMLSFLTPASVLALAGRDFPALEARMVPETVRRFLPGLFRYAARPFQALRRSKRSFNGFWVALLTLLLLLPVLMLVVFLLSSADQVFEALLGDAGEMLRRGLDRGRFLGNWLKVGVTTLLFFSFMCSLTCKGPEREEGAGEALELPCLPFIVGLAALDLIYAVFAGIQFVFLFGGGRAAAMRDGYAAYARQGFFQLAAVSGINLLAALAVGRARGRGRRAVNVLTWVLVGLTFVILISALTRMCLYIGAYGLTLLRCMTLLIMAWIAVALGAAAWKTAKPETHVFPVMLVSALILWLAFNYADIDRVIERYNRAAFESGRIGEYDSGYVDSLGFADDSQWQTSVLFPRAREDAEGGR